jgi:hypothetical protein
MIDQALELDAASVEQPRRRSLQGRSTGVEDSSEASRSFLLATSRIAANDYESLNGDWT